MPRTDIRLSGFGGQGIVLAGVILGRTASLHAGKHACQTQSYGVEARGGASRSDVVIDDREVDSPFVSKPRIFVAMSQQAYDTYIDLVPQGGVVFYDTDLVNIKDVEGIEQIGVPASKIALEELGKQLVANIVMLGAVVDKTKLLALEEVKDCIKATVRAHTVDLNIKALDRGAELVS